MIARGFFYFAPAIAYIAFNRAIIAEIVFAQY
ncbi:Uncharacterised protein [Sphingobacterium thalpophilum]|uniref:Uncharacterized protein n=1 Tax=Sphingobacterium thalpophilum TaxID=259 RepID=A0A4U9VEV4_9SPHI|nr:Uncharacterised protein [Sphingobacterium thalpophilum]